MWRFDAQAAHLQSPFSRFAAAFFLTAFSFSSTAAAAQTTVKDSPATKPQPTRRIVVSIPDRKLALLEDGRVVKIYRVAVGANSSPSPSGEFQIAQRLNNPTYSKPGVVIGPGSGNPLGTRWLGLNVKGFGIHGTNRPGSVGKNASHGCLRLKNSNVENLFARVRVGDRVSLLAERTEEVAQLFGGEPSPTTMATAQSQLASTQSSSAEDNAGGSE